MATAITGTFNSVDGYTQIITGTVALTGNYGTSTSHGDVLDFSKFSYQGIGVQSDQLPISVDFQENPPAGTAPSGYSFGYAPGTTLPLGQLTIMNGAATEYSQGSAYSAPLLAAVITFQAVFKMFL